MAAVLSEWMGYIHFQMKTLKNIGTEMSLPVLGYNLKRAIVLFEKSDSPSLSETIGI